jgi:hypothetical protein
LVGDGGGEGSMAKAAGGLRGGEERRGSMIAVYRGSVVRKEWCESVFERRKKGMRDGRKDSRLYSKF